MDARINSEQGACPDAEAERSEASDPAFPFPEHDLPHIPPFRPMLWAHVIAGTLGSWLPGDPRGFRSRRHRVHSSGDYRNPPPAGEHAGLHRHALSCSADAVRIPADLRARVGRAMLGKLHDSGVPVGALAVGSNHVHALIAVGDSDAVGPFGRAKQHASKAVSTDLPGKLWARSSHVVRVKNTGQLASTVQYIARHDRAGAWVWQHPRC